MIKSCPFCGNKNIVVVKRKNYEEALKRRGVAIMTIECVKCRVSMRDTTDKPYDNASEEIIKRWNYRGWDEP